ncbi:hypothetical protein MMC24_000892 [Lignoscripta atroalba]|nr:hypothetical protein [Lignoscripta atroalba]
MILTKGIRQQSALRAVASASKGAISTQWSQKRHIHRVPQLTHGEAFRDNGVSGMLSAEGFDIAWTQYQGYVVDCLNRLTAGTDDEHALTKNILLKHARQADRASLFNHASMAHNNHLFFSALTPNSSTPSAPFLKHIDSSFSSLPSLRSTFVATANAMFGPGFVWLIRKNNLQALTNEPELAILTTYIAGSPYPGAHFRAQPIDMATQNTNVYPRMDVSQLALQGPNSRQYAGAMGGYSRNDKKLAPGGQDLEVLLGVCTWEHVWLRDWGVGGKRGFLEAWWDRIDWSVVEANMGSMDNKMRTPLRRESAGRSYGLGQ